MDKEYMKLIKENCDFCGKIDEIKMICFNINIKNQVETEFGIWSNVHIVEFYNCNYNLKGIPKYEVNLYDVNNEFMGKCLFNSEFAFSIDNGLDISIISDGEFTDFISKYELEICDI